MPLTLTLLILTSIISVYMREDRDVLGNLRELYPHLEQLDKAIYIDARSIRVLDYISGYKSKIDIRPYTGNLSEIEDSYVVINREMIRRLREADKKKEFPKEVDKSPENWKLIKEIGKYDKNKITLYYVP